MKTTYQPPAPSIYTRLLASALAVSMVLTMPGATAWAETAKKTAPSNSVSLGFVSSTAPGEQYVPLIHDPEATAGLNAAGVNAPAPQTSMSQRPNPAAPPEANVYVIPSEAERAAPRKTSVGEEALQMAQGLMNLAATISGRFERPLTHPGQAGYDPTSLQYDAFTQNHKGQAVRGERPVVDVDQSAAAQGGLRYTISQGFMGLIAPPPSRTMMDGLGGDTNGTAAVAGNGQPQNSVLSIPDTLKLLEGEEKKIDDGLDGGLQQVIDSYKEAYVENAVLAGQNKFQLEKVNAAIAKDTKVLGDLEVEKARLEMSSMNCGLSNTCAAANQRLAEIKQQQAKLRLELKELGKNKTTLEESLKKAEYYSSAAKSMLDHFHSLRLPSGFDLDHMPEGEGGYGTQTLDQIIDAKVRAFKSEQTSVGFNKITTGYGSDNWIVAHQGALVGIGAGLAGAALLVFAAPVLLAGATAIAATFGIGAAAGYAVGAQFDSRRLSANKATIEGDKSLLKSEAYQAGTKDWLTKLQAPGLTREARFKLLADTARNGQAQQAMKSILAAQNVSATALQSLKSVAAQLQSIMNGASDAHSRFLQIAAQLGGKSTAATLAQNLQNGMSLGDAAKNLFAQHASAVMKPVEAAVKGAYGSPFMTNLKENSDLLHQQQPIAEATEKQIFNLAEKQDQNALAFAREQQFKWFDGFNGNVTRGGVSFSDYSTRLQNTYGGVLHPWDNFQEAQKNAWEASADKDYISQLGDVAWAATTSGVHSIFEVVMDPAKVAVGAAFNGLGSMVGGTDAGQWMQAVGASQLGNSVLSRSLGVTAADTVQYLMRGDNGDRISDSQLIGNYSEGKTSFETGNKYLDSFLSNTDQHLLKAGTVTSNGADILGSVDVRSASMQLGSRGATEFVNGNYFSGAAKVLGGTLAVGAQTAVEMASSMAVFNSGVQTVSGAFNPLIGGAIKGALVTVPSVEFGINIADDMGKMWQGAMAGFGGDSAKAADLIGSAGVDFFGTAGGMAGLASGRTASAAVTKLGPDATILQRGVTYTRTAAAEFAPHMALETVKFAAQGTLINAGGAVAGGYGSMLGAFGGVKASENLAQLPQFIETRGQQIRAAEAATTFEGDLAPRSAEAVHNRLGQEVFKNNLRSFNSQELAEVAKGNGGSPVDLGAHNRGVALMESSLGRGVVRLFGGQPRSSATEIGQTFKVAGDNPALKAAAIELLNERTAASTFTGAAKGAVKSATSAAARILGIPAAPPEYLSQLDAGQVVGSRAQPAAKGKPAAAALESGERAPTPSLRPEVVRDPLGTVRQFHETTQRAAEVAKSGNPKAVEAYAEAVKAERGAIDQAKQLQLLTMGAEAGRPRITDTNQRQQKFDEAIRKVDAESQAHAQIASGQAAQAELKRQGGTKIQLAEARLLQAGGQAELAFLRNDGTSGARQASYEARAALADANTRLNELRAHEADANSRGAGRRSAAIAPKAAEFMTAADVSRAQAKVFKARAGDTGALSRLGLNNESVRKAEAKLDAVHRGIEGKKITQQIGAAKERQVIAHDQKRAADAVNQRLTDLRESIRRAGDKATAADQAELGVLEAQAKSLINGTAKYGQLDKAIETARKSAGKKVLKSGIDDGLEKVSKLSESAKRLSTARADLADSVVKGLNRSLDVNKATNAIQRNIERLNSKFDQRAINSTHKNIAKLELKEADTLLGAQQKRVEALTKVMKSAGDGKVVFQDGDVKRVMTKEEATRFKGALQLEIELKQKAAGLKSWREGIEKWRDAEGAASLISDMEGKRDALSAAAGVERNRMSRKAMELHRDILDTEARIERVRNGLSENARKQDARVEALEKQEREARIEALEKQAEDRIGEFKEHANKYEKDYWKGLGSDKPARGAADPGRDARMLKLRDSTTREKLLKDLFGRSQLSETEALIFSELASRDAMGFSFKADQFRMILHNLNGDIVELSMGGGKSAALSAVFGIRSLMGKPVQGHLIVADSKEITKYTAKGPYSDFMKAMGVKEILHGDDLYGKGKEAGSNYADLKIQLGAEGNKVAVFSLDAYGHLARAQKDGDPGLRAAMRANMVGVDEADVGALVRKSFNVGRPVDATMRQKTDVYTLFDHLNNKLGATEVDISQFSHDLKSYVYAVDAKGNIVYTDRLLNSALGQLGGKYTPRQVTDVLRAMQDIREGKHVVVQGGDVHKSDLASGVQFQTRDQSTYYQIAAAMANDARLGRTPGQILKRSIGLTTHGSEATVSEAFTRVDGKKILVFGGSGTLDGAQDIAQTVYGTHRVGTIQSASFKDFMSSKDTTIRLLETRADGKQYVKTFETNGRITSQSLEEFIGKRISNSFEQGRGALAIFENETSLQGALHEYFKREIRNDRSLTVEQRSQALKEVDKIIRAADADRANNLGRIGFREVSQRDAKKGVSFMDLARANGGKIGDIAGRVQVIDRFTDAAHMDPIAETTAKGTLENGNKSMAVFAIERAGRALNFKGEVNEIIVGAQKYNRGDLLQILGRTGRTGNTDPASNGRYDTNRDVLIDAGVMQRSAEAIQRLSTYVEGKAEYKGLSRDLQQQLTSINSVSEKLGTRTPISQESLGAALQANAAYRLLEAKDGATAFRLSSEVVTKLAKEPLGLMQSVAKGADVAILEAVYDKLRGGGYDNSRNIFRAGEFKSSQQIARELFESGLSQSESMWRDLATNKNLSPELAVEAAARLRDVLETKTQVTELFSNDKSSAKGLAFAHIDPMNSNNAAKVAEVVRGLSDALLPSESSTSRVAEHSVAIAAERATEAIRTRGTAGVSNAALDRVGDLARRAAAANPTMQNGLVSQLAMVPAGQPNAIRQVLMSQAGIPSNHTPANPSWVPNSVVANPVVGLLSNAVDAVSAPFAGYRQARAWGIGVAGSVKQGLQQSVQSTPDAPQQVGFTLKQFVKDPESTFIQDALTLQANSNPGAVAAALTNPAIERWAMEAAESAKTPQEGLARQRLVTEKLNHIAEIARNAPRSAVETGQGYTVARAKGDPAPVEMVVHKWTPEAAIKAAQMMNFGAAANVPVTIHVPAGTDDSHPIYKLLAPKALRAARENGFKTIRPDGKSLIDITDEKSSLRIGLGGRAAGAFAATHLPRADVAGAAKLLGKVLPLRDKIQELRDELVKAQKTDGEKKALTESDQKLLKQLEDASSEIRPLQSQLTALLRDIQDAAPVMADAVRMMDASPEARRQWNSVFSAIAATDDHHEAELAILKGLEPSADQLKSVISAQFPTLKEAQVSRIVRSILDGSEFKTAILSKKQVGVPSPAGSLVEADPNAQFNFWLNVETELNKAGLGPAHHVRLTASKAPAVVLQLDDIDADAFHRIMENRLSSDIVYAGDKSGVESFYAGLREALKNARTAAASQFEKSFELPAVNIRDAFATREQLNTLISPALMLIVGALFSPAWLMLASAPMAWPLLKQVIRGEKPSLGASVPTFKGTVISPALQFGLIAGVLLAGSIGLGVPVGLFLLGLFAKAHAAATLANVGFGALRHLHENFAPGALTPVSGAFSSQAQPSLLRRAIANPQVRRIAVLAPSMLLVGGVLSSLFANPVVGGARIAAGTAAASSPLVVIGGMLAVAVLAGVFLTNKNPSDPRDPTDPKLPTRSQQIWAALQSNA